VTTGAVPAVVEEVRQLLIRYGSATP